MAVLSDAPLDHAPPTLREKVTLGMQVVISLATIGFAVYLLAFATVGGEIATMAAGWIGLVVGFWLR